MYNVPAAEAHRSQKGATLIELGSLDKAARTSPDQERFERLGAASSLTQAVIALLNNAEGSLEEGHPAARSCISRALSLLEAERQRWRMGAEGPAAPARGGLSPSRARRSKDHIEQNLDGTIRIDDLTAIARLSVRHFSLAFKQTLGHPPHAYIVRRRIEKAQQLMLLTDEPLSQIALACGLADQAHLSKWFRRLVGATPNAWRKEHRA